MSEHRSRRDAPSGTHRRQPADSLDAIFTEIYRTNHWGSPETISGRGSELRQTEAVRAGLAHILAAYRIRTVVDAGCGDLNWIRHVAGFERLDSYLGVDIVAELIGDCQSRYGSARIAFKRADLTREDMPTADLIICRDFLVHLTIGQVLTVLSSIVRSGSGYLLATTYVHLPDNRETKGGHWRPINLQAPPFNLPDPIEYIDTDFTDEGRNQPGNGLGLWKVSQVPNGH